MQRCFAERQDHQHPSNPPLGRAADAMSRGIFGSLKGGQPTINESIRTMLQEVELAKRSFSGSAIRASVDKFVSFDDTIVASAGVDIFRATNSGPLSFQEGFFDQAALIERLNQIARQRTVPQMPLWIHGPTVARPSRQPSRRRDPTLFFICR